MILEFWHGAFGGKAADFAAVYERLKSVKMFFEKGKKSPGGCAPSGLRITVLGYFSMIFTSAFVAIAFMLTSGITIVEKPASVSVCVIEALT